MCIRLKNCCPFNGKSSQTDANRLQARSQNCSGGGGGVGVGGAHLENRDQIIKVIQLVPKNNFEI